MKTGFVWGDPERYGNYRRAVEVAGGRLRFGGDPLDCDFLLLPGGGDLEPWRYGQENTASRSLEPERDAAELALIDLFLNLGKPVFGVCRGMQTLNVFFGGTLLQDIPDHGQVGGRDRLHEVRTVGELAALCGEDVTVNSAHHQALDRLGAGLEAVQWAPDGVVEAVCHRSLPVWGVQWHPERLDGPLGQTLIRAAMEMKP